MNKVLMKKFQKVTRIRSKTKLSRLYMLYEEYPEELEVVLNDKLSATDFNCIKRILNYGTYSSVVNNIDSYKYWKELVDKSFDKIVSYTTTGLGRYTKEEVFLGIADRRGMTYMDKFNAMSEYDGVYFDTIIDKMSATKLTKRRMRTIMLCSSVPEACEALSVSSSCLGNICYSALKSIKSYIIYTQSTGVCNDIRKC